MKRTSMEEIISFSQLRKYLSQEEQEKIASAMGTSIDEINTRLSGKDKEDEFILILLLMTCCKNLSAFDEGVSKLFETATSDLILELNDGKKFLLEIKSTTDDKFKISSGNLKKRIDYASSYSLDLYFAISIKGFWMLFKSDYLVAKSGKIDISDYLKSELDDILGICSYMFPKELSIRSVYIRGEYKKPIGINHPEYGNLASYELLYNGKKVFRIKGSNSSYKGYSMILEAMQDRMSVVNQNIESNGNVTVVVESFEDKDGCLHFISEYLFLLAPIRHTENSDGELYTERSAIESLKCDEYVPAFQIEHIRGMMSWLVQQGVPIKRAKNGVIREF